MFALIESGGWVMLPLIVCSVLALAITLERLWSLQTRRIVPQHLVAQVWQLYKKDELTKEHIQSLRDGSGLGRILAAGLANSKHSRSIMKESIEDTGRQVVHELERYLTTLGSIASVTPLLGLLGTVIGMIQVFAIIVSSGVGDPAVLAGGISKALITTATGLTVAIPSLLMFRYFNGRVNTLVIIMEAEAMKMVEVMHAAREADE